MKVKFSGLFQIIAIHFSKHTAKAQGSISTKPFRKNKSAFEFQELKKKKLILYLAKLKPQENEEIHAVEKEKRKKRTVIRFTRKNKRKMKINDKLK